ncbi:beta-lactamase family protein [Lentzea tibetensis]|uniref:Beta-lactamase family protein n=2 Tax=Lentzea tibetensis TaxID=2591470 RepID=A0A563ESU2_9PSEU|nr:beta-lactamase family protein [Lentzea tibetensis]
MWFPMICDPAFRSVVEAFREGVGDGGAALSITAGGRTVVDVWHGDWERDTVVNVFSVTKGWLAALAHRLVDNGSLDLDAPVSRYWPEFRAPVTVAQLLSHQAGLPALRAGLPAESLYSWDAMTSALAAETPWWEPGTGHGYHVVTFGWLVGEVLRRVTGEDVRTLVETELGVPDLFVGLPEHADSRAAELVNGGVAGDMPIPLPIAVKALANPPSLLVPGVANTLAWRRAQIPAANGHASARALASLYGGLTGLDVPVRSDGHDQVMNGNTRFGLGFMLPNEVRPFSPNPRAFGHPGAGGSLAFADPDTGIGFGYTTNRLVISTSGADARWTTMVDELYQI